MATTPRVDRARSPGPMAGVGRWAARTPRSAGRAALYSPPHLTAIWPDVVPTNSFQNQCREGGAMQGHMSWAPFLHAQDAQEIRDDPEERADVLERARRRAGVVPGDAPAARPDRRCGTCRTLERNAGRVLPAGRLRRLLEPDRARLHAYLDRHADIPARLDRVVRPVPGRRHRVLRGMAAQNTTPSGSSSALEPRRHARGRDLLPRRRLRAAERLGERYFEEQLASSPLAADDASGGRGRGAGAHLRHGRRRRPRTPEGKLDHGGDWREEWEWPLAPGASRRPTTSTPTRAATPSAGAPDERRGTGSIPTIRCRRGGLFCAIGELPNEEAERSIRPGHGCSAPRCACATSSTPGPVDQKESPAFFGSERAVPAAVGAPGRARLPDRAARRADRGDGAG